MTIRCPTALRTSGRPAGTTHWQIGPAFAGDELDSVVGVLPELPRSEVWEIAAARADLVADVIAAAAVPGPVRSPCYTYTRDGVEKMAQDMYER
jgi:hypothetical protein